MRETSVEEKETRRNKRDATIVYERVTSWNDRGFERSSDRTSKRTPMNTHISVVQACENNIYIDVSKALKMCVNIAWNQSNMIDKWLYMCVEKD